ncbi:MAG: hypothetical protein GTN49_02315 [candidate division Zixibacteria bacterium]|nr:hypothetical protein [candidate division Zixibacteria bacterium]
MLWPAWVAAVDEVLPGEEGGEEAPGEEAAPAEEEPAPEEEERLLPYRERDAWLDAGVLGLADELGEEFPLSFKSWALLEDLKLEPWLRDWRDIARAARYFYASGFEEPFDRELMRDSYRAIKEEEEFYAWEEERGLIPDIELGRESDIKFEGRKLFTAGYSKTTYPGGNPIYGEKGQPAGDFTMEGELQLRIEGTVLRKTHVYVDYDDTRENETRNQVSVVYKGDPDELVQEAAFGDIMLSLPSTEFISYSSSRAVFGAKVDLKYKWARLMAIASREKGRTEKATFTGGAELTSIIVPDTGYAARKFFQLHTYYDKGADKTYFEGDRKIYKDAGGQPLVEVFVQYATGQFPPGVTQYRLEAYQFDDSRGDGEGPIGKPLVEKNLPSRKLARGVEYDVDVEKGIITFKTTVNQQDKLAVAYVIADGGNTFKHAIGYKPDGKGGYVLNLDERLKCIKEATLTGPMQRYELRNRYYLGSTNIRSITLVVKLLDNNNSENDPKFPGKTYLYSYGLDQNDDGRVDQADFIDFTNGYVIVPDINRNILSEKREFKRRIYNGDNYLYNLPFDYDDNGKVEGPDAYHPDVESKLKFHFEYQSLKPSFFLHANIIPGSETVTLDGRVLVPNQDYWIDYDSGFLELLTEGAETPGAVLEVTYEYKPLFALLTKSLVGGRFQFGPDDDRYAATTLIAEFTSKPPRGEIPKLEEAPANHFVFDADARYRFYPEFMTALADAVPGAHTTEGSTFDVEAELARSYKDVNTVGQALVDDMEDARQLSSMPMKVEAWKHASAPAVEGLNQRNRGSRLLELKTSPTFFNEVDPDWPRDTLEVLVVGALPNNPGGPDKPYKWAGIHRVLSTTGVDFTDARFEYVEILMNLNNLTGDTGDDVRGGVLHLELGTVNEDADGNTVLGTEELDREGRLAPDKDVGYDFNNTKDQKPPAEPPKPPGNIFTKINNKNVIDTEDNNRNTVLDTRDDYFTYEIKLEEVLDNSSPYVVRGPRDKDPLNPGWYVLRVPLQFDTAETAGLPDATAIEVLRLWLEAETKDDFPSGSALILGMLSFSAMKWEDPELEPDKGLNQMKISTKDSRHDGDYVPLAPREDPETKTLEREQALVVEYILTDWEDIGVMTEEGFTRWGAGNNKYDTEDANHNGILDPGEDVGVGPYHFGAGNGRLDEEPAPEGSTRYTAYQSQDYSHYRRLAFYYFNRTPQDNGGRESANDIIFIRFGADDDNYYEYATQMAGKQTWIPVDVDLERFLALQVKGQPLIEAGEAITYRHYRIVGDPSFLNIVETRVGVRTKQPRDGGSGGFLAFREVWVNDIKLLEPERQVGAAARASTALDFGNFIKVSGGFRDVGAGFEEIGTTAAARTTTASRNADATLELSKFMPDLWNVRMPVSGSVTKSETVTEEKYDPKKSIYSQGRTVGVSRRIGISFSKYKLPSWDFDFRNSDSVNYKFARTVESDTYSGGADYEVHPRRRYLPVNVRSEFDRQFQKTTYGEKEKEPANTDWVTDDNRNSVKFEPLEDLEITPSYDYEYTRDRKDKTEESFDESYGMRVDYFFVKGVRPGTSYTSSYREIAELSGEGGGLPEMDRGPNLGRGETLDISLSTTNSFMVPVDVGKLTGERARGLNKWSITPSYELIRSSSYTGMESRAPMSYRMGRDHVMREFADTEKFVNSRRRYSVTVNNRFRPLEFLSYRTGTKWENWDFIQTDFDYSYSNEFVNTTGSPSRTISTTFPDVDIQLYGTANFPLVAAYLDRSTVDITYYRKRTDRVREDYEIKHKPGISWRATWTRNFRTRADYNYGYTIARELDRENNPVGDERIVKEENPSLTVYYDVANPRGFKVPILGTLRWRNELNLTAGVSFTKVRGVNAAQDDTDEWEYTASGGYYVTTNLRADVTGTLSRYKNLTSAGLDFVTIGVNGNFEIIF